MLPRTVLFVESLAAVKKPLVSLATVMRSSLLAVPVSLILSSEES